MTDSLEKNVAGAVSVAHLASDPGYAQTQFIQHSATLGTRKIGMCDIVNNPAGAYPDPPLSEFSLQIATAGGASGEFDLGARTFHTELSRGTTLLAPPQTACSYVLDNTFSLINLGLPVPLFDEAMLAFNGAHRPDLEKLHSIAFRDPRIEGMGAEVLRQSRTDRGTDALAVDHAAFGIVALLVDKAGKVTRRPGTPTPLSNAEFARAVELMHDRIEEGVTLTELARLSGRNVYQFSRAFRLRAGVPPYKYLIWLRIERARGMLEATDMPLVEIAYACGFSSQAHMTTVFTNTLSTTPGEFRKNR
ncbi:MAG: AraC family transcriptional regulator [Pseudomonadota bacterium]